MLTDEQRLALQGAIHTFGEGVLSGSGPKISESRADLVELVESFLDPLRPRDPKAELPPEGRVVLCSIPDDGDGWMVVTGSLGREWRAKLARVALAEEVSGLAARAGELTAELEQIATEKDAALLAAPMPVEGLSIGDEGVMLNGLPLDQASTMEQIRACTAIGSALNPELRIALVRHGNDLDGEALTAFYAECSARGVQAWVERIEGSTEGAIVIEEGLVVGAVTEPAS